MKFRSTFPWRFCFFLAVARKLCHFDKLSPTSLCFELRIIQSCSCLRKLTKVNSFSELATPVGCDDANRSVRYREVTVWWMRIGKYLPVIKYHLNDVIIMRYFLASWVNKALLTTTENDWCAVDCGIMKAAKDTNKKQSSICIPICRGILNVTTREEGEACEPEMPTGKKIPELKLRWTRGEEGEEEGVCENGVLGRERERRGDLHLIV